MSGDDKAEAEGKEAAATDDQGELLRRRVTRPGREFGQEFRESELREPVFGESGARFEVEPVRPRPLEAPVPKTRGFIRVGGSSKPTLDVAVAFLADLAGHNIPMAVAAAALTELGQRFSRLSEDEMAVFDVLRLLAQGGRIYKVWIEEDELLAAMDQGLDIEDRRRLLANMKSRGLLEEGVGKWRAVW